MTHYLWGIDPGPTESAYVMYDPDLKRPMAWNKIPNHGMLNLLEERALIDVRHDDRCAIEMIESYGMAVGRSTFETCVWIGRFIDRWCHGTVRDEPTRVSRMDCKMHICHSPKAGDKNIRQALIDRFGPKGTKANPGVLYGMKADCWAALAVAVTAAETRQLWTPQGV